ncbi:MAG: antitoxin Xre-like helix-turn-helix domain-containing protein [Terracidiphilus sp.]|jgi:putative toxin-antitoxin system antitoxin component (TIGR02293 family)
MGQTASVPAVPQPFQFDWQAVEKGMPLSLLEEFAARTGFPIKDLLEVVIPPRTLKHRKLRKEPLSLDESDRLARVARIYDLAVKVFGDAVDGREWLMFAIDRFEGRTALEMLRTDAGARQVEEMLYQIDEGVFA